jgi:hypothetical protein
MAKPRGVTAKVKMRRGRLSDATKIVGEGLFEAGRVIVEQASAVAPDSPLDPYPLGEGLPKQGGVLAYVGDEKVDGYSIRGPQPAKPRAARVLTNNHSVSVLVLWGFPARFVEGGTVNHGPQPFLAPTRDRLAHTIPKIVGDVTRPRLKGNW